MPGTAVPRVLCFATSPFALLRGPPLRGSDGALGSPILTPLHVKARTLIRGLPTFADAMGKATLSSQFFAAVQETGNPKLPALLAVLHLREIEHQSFQVRLYDGVQRNYCCSTTNDLYPQLSQKMADNDVPFVIRVDEVVIQDEVLTKENRPVRMIFIKKGAVLKCAPPDDAFEIVRSTQGRSQRRQEKSLDRAGIENVEPRPLGVHEHTSPASTSAHVEAVPPTTPKTTPRKRPNQVTPDKTGGSPATPIAFINPHIKEYKLCGLAHDKTNVMQITSEKRAHVHNRVFSFLLTDGNCDEIKISAYDDLADYYYQLVENDKMYFVTSNGNVASSLRNLNPSYNVTNTSYEITLIKRNMVQPCPPSVETINLPPLHLKRVLIKNLTGMQEKFVDVLGIVTNISELQEVTIYKSNRETYKRVVTLLDESNTSVHLIMWGSEADRFSEEALNRALAVQRVVVKEWNGNYSLQVVGTTKLQQDPHSTAARSLYGWHANRNPEAAVVCISELNDFAAMQFLRDMRFIGSMANVPTSYLNEDSRGTYFNVVGRIVDVKRNNVFYRACFNNECRKKVVETPEGSGMYRCESCDASSADFKYITLLSILIADCTGSHWVNMFGDPANKLLDIPNSEHLGFMDTDELNTVLDRIMFKQMVFRVRAKVDQYNGAETVKWNCFEASPVPLTSYLKVLRDTANRIL